MDFTSSKITGIPPYQGMKYSRRVRKKKKKLEESMKNESPKGTLGVFQAPFQRSAGCFEGGSKRRIFRIVPDTFPFSRFRGTEYWIEETRRVVTFSPSYARNTATYIAIVLCDARTYRPPRVCETWKFIIPRGMYPPTFIKSFIHFLIHQMLSDVRNDNGTEQFLGKVFGEGVASYCSKVKVTLV